MLDLLVHLANLLISPSSGRNTWDLQKQESWEQCYDVHCANTCLQVLNTEGYSNTLCEQSFGDIDKFHLFEKLVIVFYKILNAK